MSIRSSDVPGSKSRPGSILPNYDSPVSILPAGLSKSASSLPHPSPTSAPPPSSPSSLPRANISILPQPPRPALTAAPPPMEEAHSYRVLVVDDDEVTLKSVARGFERLGIEVEGISSAKDALQRLSERLFDCVLTDWLMPEMSGADLLAELKTVCPDLPVIVMSGSHRVEFAVSAVRAGAYDCLQKPFPSVDAAALVVTNAAKQHRLALSVSVLKRKLTAQLTFGDLVGSSHAMTEVYRFIESAARTNSTVLVLGESGTGKELVARAIHRYSLRAQKPFVSVNCAAIPSELVESELFGHARGAFTGASATRAGLFESAHQGTLFLDEIGDLPLPVQAHLLRALQLGEIRRVGSDETRTVDVRIIAATNVDLEARVAEGKFRSDLYYRVNVLRVDLPPLRERGEDVVLIGQRFSERHALRLGIAVKPFSADAMEALRAYSWPGNVRELENLLERAYAIASGEMLTARDLSIATEGRKAGTGQSAAASARPAEGIFTTDLASLPYAEARRRVLARFEETYTKTLLDQAGGNLAEAARLAGVDRSNFRRLAIRAKVRGKE